MKKRRLTVVTDVVVVVVVVAVAVFVVLVLVAVVVVVEELAVTSERKIGRAHV